MNAKMNLEGIGCEPATLGAVLYADNAAPPVLESDWVRLVHAMAAGDQFALRELFTRTHRLVFTLIIRINPNAATAEELTVDVFHDLWRRASTYEPQNGTVLGWIINQARSRAIDRLRLEHRRKRTAPSEGFALYDNAKRPEEDVERIQQSPRVRNALTALNREERQAIESTVARSLVDWPTGVLRPSESLWPVLAQRIAIESGQSSLTDESCNRAEPPWEHVAPGISCKLLATDPQRHRVSMLVRLDRGAEYPPHKHADVEELHLLDGELWINSRRLKPGDYNRAEVGTMDLRVWSKTGCTCILMTSTRDALLGTADSSFIP